MIQPTPEQTPEPAVEPLVPPSGPDDLSTHAHRQLIGWLGALLPLALWIMAAWRPIEKPGRWNHLNSISAYYYSGAVAVFVGVLVALAVFLFTYQGYNNRDRWIDRLSAVVAGVAAIGVALFPTSAPVDVPKLDWWFRWIGVVHYVSAGVLFGSFVVFSLYLFRKSNVRMGASLPKEKRIRNAVYLICGVAMLGCMGWIALAAPAKKPIFWPETLALEFFAVAWLVKGRADWTVARAGERTRRYVGRRTRSYARGRRRS